MTPDQVHAMQTTSSNTIGTKRILLIDDDQTFLAYATFILTQAGYHVLEARDGCEALKRVEEHQIRGIHIDLLVTDMLMPGMSGLSLLRQLSVLHIRTPVLVISGFLDENKRRELQRLKYRDILVKPFNPQDLLNLVESLTGAGNCRNLPEPGALDRSA